MTEPIKLNIYDENYEIIKTAEILFIPFGRLEDIAQMAQEIGKMENIIDQVKAISGFMVKIFRGKLTSEELKEGTEYDEVLNTFYEIVNYVASQTQQLNFKPGKKA